ncbi:MAG: hypothetical protein V4667_09430 [Bacteroidota bacterium]
MKLDYIENINAYGDNVVRLYDFEMAEANKFSSLIQQLITNALSIDLSSIDFIEARNCNLILRICDTDEGITSENDVDFYCDLTVAAYKNMLKLIEPFCKKKTKAHQFLYDVDSPTDLLFSPAGTW